MQPGQQELTPAQEAEARRLADERIAAQLSTEPVDDAEAEDWVHSVYQVAGRASPRQILWIESPMRLLPLLLPESVRECVGANLYYSLRPSLWESLWDSVGESMRESVGANLDEGVWPSKGEPVWPSVRERLWPRVETHVHFGRDDNLRSRLEASMPDNAWENWWKRARESLEASAGEHLWECMEDTLEGWVRAGVWHRVGERVRRYVEASLWGRLRANVLRANLSGHALEQVRQCLLGCMVDSLDVSLGAYLHAPWLAVSAFFDHYLVPNDLLALAHLNTLVSGYWLGRDRAALVRRPVRLARDEQGRLHSATGKCLEYPDGWGLYAWHGVQVSEQIIVHPERLTREDWLKARNVEIMRVIQERMGGRFVRELGGDVIDTGPRGTLYEVNLHSDPDRVARYVQVQGASTERQYFLRVSPSIPTAAEAAAWSFGLSVEDYGPAQET